MTPEEFNAMIKDFDRGCNKLLEVKEKEYSDGKDRLVQFKTAATLENTSPVASCAGMMIKHTTKLYSMLDEYYTGKVFTIRQWNEVLYDQSNYLRILKAVLKDVGAI